MLQEQKVTDLPLGMHELVFLPTVRFCSFIQYFYAISRCMHPVTESI